MSARVLIIDANSERTQQLALALAAAGFEVIDVVPDTGDIYGAVRRLAPDAILIDAESPNRDTLEGLAVIGQRFPRPILMLSESADTELVHDAARMGISTYAVEGLSPALLKSMIEVTIAHFRSRAALTAELLQARQALDERRTIDQAKRRLMERRGISEDEAYHCLRRQAMSRGMRIAELAGDVLSGKLEP